ncbi:MAG TPA: glycosyltransferase [Blastocatellia bacterium]|nr:glycosyltransferase [Blastocatellia bacterium]
MKKLLVYSHDTYGLGNIKRMLTICQYLLEVIPELSILLVTGSPVVHSLRLPGLPGLMDYIKLPCLTRVGRGEYTTKYLSSGLSEAVRLRSDLILTTVINFKPDLLMVDKKPLGVKRELAATLDYLRVGLPKTNQILILRDILDSPDAIVSNWERNGHYEAISRFYNRVMILGEQEIFDPIEEYSFPPSVVDKTEFCGYLRKEAKPGSRLEMRARLRVGDDQRLVLVTTGGGEDGYDVIDAYLKGLGSFPIDPDLRSLIVCGPEMPERQRTQLQERAAADPGLIFYESTGEMLGLMAAADVVVAMGGYNTVCEILSLRKRAIVVPRVRPTEEQWIRADRMSRLGLFQTLHPDQLTPERLMRALSESLASPSEPARPGPVDLNALSVIAKRVEELLPRHGDLRI